MKTLDPRNKRATAIPITSFVGASGQEHKVLGPEFWPDEAHILLQSGEDAKVYAGIRMIVGDGPYDDFVAAGGTGLMLWEHVAAEAGDAGGPADVGESSGSGTLSTVPEPPLQNPSLPESTA